MPMLFPLATPPAGWLARHCIPLVFPLALFTKAELFPPATLPQEQVETKLSSIQTATGNLSKNLLTKIRLQQEALARAESDSGTKPSAAEFKDFQARSEVRVGSLEERVRVGRAEDEAARAAGLQAVRDEVRATAAAEVAAGRAEVDKRVGDEMELRDKNLRGLVSEQSAERTAAAEARVEAAAVRGGGALAAAQAGLEARVDSAVQVCSTCLGL